jgi:hypothetical protein
MTKWCLSVSGMGSEKETGSAEGAEASGGQNCGLDLINSSLVPLFPTLSVSESYGLLSLKYTPKPSISSICAATHPRHHLAPLHASNNLSPGLPDSSSFPHPHTAVFGPFQEPSLAIPFTFQVAACHG